MCSYPIPNILLPHDIEAQLQKCLSKDKSQPDRSQRESQVEPTGNGDIARIENSSTEEKS